MKQLIEKLFQRMPLSSGEEIDKMKTELLTAAEHGPVALDSCFKRVHQALIQRAETLAQQLEHKLGAS